jgi:3-oxoacyl-[acyl-carrier-protein] synthase-3
LFGDAAAATLVSGVDHVATDGAEPFIGPFVYGTDGSGSSNLMVPAGGMRRPHTEASAEVRVDDRGNLRSDDNLFMDGPEIFAFSLRTVPKAVRELLALAGMETEEVDLFVFHQANQHMLNHLRKKMKIPEDKFYFALREVGNTVSATIPIALRQAIDEQALGPGQTALIVGFGVGYSWGTTLIRLGG